MQQLRDENSTLKSRLCSLSNRNEQPSEVELNSPIGAGENGGHWKKSDGAKDDMHATMDSGQQHHVAGGGSPIYASVLHATGVRSIDTTGATELEPVVRVAEEVRRKLA